MSMYVLFLILDKLPFCVNGRIAFFCVNGRIAIRPYKCLIVSFAGAKVRRFFKLANFLRVFFKIFLIYFLSD